MHRALPSALALALAAGCAVDTYPVQVDSNEVRAGSMVMQLDYTEADPVLRLWLRFAVEVEDSCPRLDDAARVVMLRDTEQVELEVTSRGEGSETLDCALKCHDLVAFETQCAPLQAELRGAVVEQILAADELRVALADDLATLGMTVPGAGLQRRIPTFPEGSEAAVETDTSQLAFTKVPYHWPHLDRAHWVNQWPDNFPASRDGGFSAFNLDRSIDTVNGTQDLKLIVRNDAPRGVRKVFFGATTEAGACDFARCDGIEHVTSATVTVVDLD